MKSSIIFYSQTIHCELRGREISMIRHIVACHCTVTIGIESVGLAHDVSHSQCQQAYSHDDDSCPSNDRTCVMQQCTDKGPLMHHTMTLMRSVSTYCDVTTKYRSSVMKAACFERKTKRRWHVHRCNKYIVTHWTLHIRSKQRSRKIFVTHTCIDMSINVTTTVEHVGHCT